MKAAVEEAEGPMTEQRSLGGVSKRVLRRESQTGKWIGFGVQEKMEKEQHLEGLSLRFINKARLFIWMRFWWVRLSEDMFKVSSG